ncbi:MAG: amidohydrolase family protein [Acidobacteria bacterium]|nr:amidohydrolase family protein [Acidobacteriota bacterium]
MITIIKAHWVLPITASPIEEGAVAIDSDRIVAIGPAIEIETRFSGAAINDRGRSVILPGLVNVHSHLELTAFRGRLEEPHFQGWIAEVTRLKSQFKPDEFLASARLGCIEAIRAGITTLADTCDTSAPLAALIESGQRGIVFQECFGPQTEQAQSSIDALKFKLEAHAARLDEAGKQAQSRVHYGISPHAPYTVSAELYRRAVRLASDNQLDIAIHAAESTDETKLLEDGSGAFGELLRRRGIGFSPPGSSTIKYLHRLGVLDAAPLLIHCVRVDQEDIELIARHSARVAHCPKSNAKFAHGIAPLIEMEKAGVRIAVGTDSVASNNTVDLIEEARFCSLLHRAAKRDATLCSASRMLELMTIEGARVLGMDNEIGSLEVGKQADLIVIDLEGVHNTPHYDPATAVIFSCSARDVSLTVVAGQVLYQDGRVVALNEQAIMQSFNTKGQRGQRDKGSK